MMNAQGDDDDEIFVYMGGDQRVPALVRRAKIHEDVKIVRARAFYERRQLISVEFHDGIEIIEEFAFDGCPSLRGPIKLLGVKIIKKLAFCECPLTDVEFGDKLETIEDEAFYGCKALRSIMMPTVRTVGHHAFLSCEVLSHVEFGEGLCVLHRGAFGDCHKLERIVLPLKDIIIEEYVFSGCPKLATVDLVGGINQTVASLHMESWRSEMNDEINRINQVLPTFTAWHKTEEIQQWMESAFRQLNHYKDQHQKLLKEATTLLELALWKANLDHNEGGKLANEGVRITRSRKRARKEICVTSGASIVIKNVLPFLQLLE